MFACTYRSSGGNCMPNHSYTNLPAYNYAACFEAPTFWHIHMNSSPVADHISKKNEEVIQPSLMNILMTLVN